ncbi:MAG: Crp/Fnr family transcriptional regulator [Anaerovoracaceae bacterium]
MEFSKYFLVWDKISEKHKRIVEENVILRKVEKGSIIHNGDIECTGLLLVKTGQLRAFIISDEGKEISIYRLFEYDICLFSAACIMNSIQFDITVEAEKNSEFWIIPSDIYKQIMQESLTVANFTNELMASRFSDVMWLMEQIMWRSFDKRLAEFILEETSIEGSSSIKITHEMIGNHLGNPREVVTRMLRYFQSEGMIKLSRGTIEIVDKDKISALADA